MSGDFSVVDKFVEEILIDLMAEKVMSIGAQASSTRGVQESPLTERRSEPSRTVPEKRTKHRDDLANVKLIPSIMPDCILPLASMVSHDSVPRGFNYIVIIAYLPKGIRVVGLQLERVIMLKFSDFNLGDRKNYGMIAPRKYLTKTTGKKSKIIPQPWTMDITRSTILNVMNIPHFGRHQKVNTCVKLLLS
jgi:hypothetical protein